MHVGRAHILQSIDYTRSQYQYRHRHRHRHPDTVHVLNSHTISLNELLHKTWIAVLSKGHSTNETMNFCCWLSITCTQIPQLLHFSLSLALTRTCRQFYPQLSQHGFGQSKWNPNLFDEVINIIRTTTIITNKKENQINKQTNNNHNWMNVWMNLWMIERMNEKYQKRKKNKTIQT